LREFECRNPSEHFGFGRNDESETFRLLPMKEFNDLRRDKPLKEFN
jgi:hypothetical protein